MLRLLRVTEHKPTRLRLRVLSSFTLVLVMTGLSPSASAERARRPLRTEWIVDGALGAVWLGLLPFALRDTTSQATIGPVFRGPEDVSLFDEAVAARQLSSELIDEETITDGELFIALGGSLTSALVLAYGLSPLFDSGSESRRWYGEQALAFFVGALQTLLGTIVLTETAKNNAGRLRPDFIDRADRYYCHLAEVPDLYRSRCSALEAGGELGAAVDEDVLQRGRRSFWSGHSALSFAAMTYAALYVGGRMVWGRSATTVTRVIGLFAQGASLTAAGFIASSRLSDGVHHVEDVVVGSALGITLAMVGYWLHFDSSGEVRRGISLQAMPTQDGVAAAVSGTF
jgi:membrane-associated phospholipid phosphatase